MVGSSSRPESSSLSYSLKLNEGRAVDAGGVATNPVVCKAMKDDRDGSVVATLILETGILGTSFP